MISILFWTTEQKKLLENLNEKKSTIILGDYGTGKTIILMAIAKKVMKMGLKVVYINGLDHVDLFFNYYYKTTEDVLDVIVKSMFGSVAEVLDIGTLRLNYLSRHPELKQTLRVDTLELINDYITSLGSAKDTVVSPMPNTKSLLTLLLQVLCDELHLGGIQAWGGPGHNLSGVQKLLENMRDTFLMAWVVPSTSSLVDDYAADVRPGELASLAEEVGFSLVPLLNVMRNSNSISSAVSPENIKIKHPNQTYTSPIPSGDCSSSTVIGPRPSWLMFKCDKSRDFSYRPDHRVIAGCVNQFLKGREQIKQIAILCDRTVSPRELLPLLTVTGRNILLYDAGVEAFKKIYEPHYYEADLVKQREDLVDWLETGGILLTHDKMFRGCEAETVVFVTDCWGGVFGVQRRGGATRAIADLGLVTDAWVLSSDGRGQEKYDQKRDQIRQHFDLINVLETEDGDFKLEMSDIPSEDLGLPPPFHIINPLA